MKDSDFHKVLGERIHQLRKRQQMTQAELARALGLSQQSVFAIELGDRRVSLDKVPTLLRVFRVSCEQLLGIAPMLPGRASRVSPAEQRLVEPRRPPNFPHLWPLETPPPLM
jgi:transcriptional regulator with XRE-family HTH domain